MIIEQGTRAIVIDANHSEEHLWLKLLASEDEHFAKENSCCLYVLGISQLHYLCVDHISYDLVSEDNYFVLLFKCEIYGHAWGFPVFPVPSLAKENKLKHFPFEISLKTSTWANKIDNPLLIISVFNHFFS